ncbi:hypothetical protein CAL27_20595 [Bordetella genomosp. 1]|uniref:FHA domain-containing protein n=2 Tax=Bordetella genomosp. 1 TaxID=1395607 RepID=A0ABX4EU95_9BORD|nr:hypothetical protein CAL27_20595 [Bordetella genomosp. 1]
MGTRAGVRWRVAGDSGPRHTSRNTSRYIHRHIRRQGSRRWARWGAPRSGRCRPAHHRRSAGGWRAISMGGAMSPSVSLELHFESGRREQCRHALPLQIGRGADCALRLPGWRVGRRHARLLMQGDALFIEDFGTLSGTYVNGVRVATYGPLNAADGIVIGACRLRVLALGAGPDAEATVPSVPLPAAPPPATPLPAAPIPGAAIPDAPGAAAPVTGASGRVPADPSHASESAPLSQNRSAQTPQDDARAQRSPASSGGPAGHAAAGAAIAREAGPRDGLPRGGSLGGVALGSEACRSLGVAHPCLGRTDGGCGGRGKGTCGGPAPITPEVRALRVRLHAELLERLELRRRDVAGMSDAVLREQAAAHMRALVAELEAERQAAARAASGGAAPSGGVTDAAAQAGDGSHSRGAAPVRGSGLPEALDLARLSADVLDEALGLGPLEALLADPTVTEIMVNRFDRIYVERAGRIEHHAAEFSGEAAVRGVLERIVAPLGRRVDESAPMVDARLADGSRVNAVIPPIALGGAVITIRKFPQRRWRMADLVAAGALDAAMAAFLQHAVRTRRSIVVSGGTGAGKTTLLNVLSDAIPEGERLITIEDAAELRLAHAHRIALEARPANAEGRGRVEIRDLVRNALRMRPDRIVVGECRGAEAFDMLTAMNTGHEGSLTTLHANSPRDALGRLESMVLMAGLDLPLPVVREYVASSVDLVVQQSRLASGLRVITDIVEITGIESGCIQTQALFVHDARRGFVATDALAMSPAPWRVQADILLDAVDATAAGRAFGMPVAGDPVATITAAMAAANATSDATSYATSNRASDMASDMASDTTRAATSAAAQPLAASAGAATTARAAAAW